jgi:hypothetical protein
VRAFDNIACILKKGKLFCTLAEYGLTYDRRFPLLLEEYFYCHPQRFFAWDPFRQQGGVFSRHIGWEWGKIPTWWEKFPLWKWDMFGKIPTIPTWSEKFRHGRKNSDMVGKKDWEGYMKA